MIGADGSAYPIGLGGMRTGSHVIRDPSGDLGSSIYVTPARGLSSQDGSERVTLSQPANGGGNVLDEQPYSPNPGTAGEIDSASIQTKFIDLPGVPGVVMSDYNDAAGDVTAFGYSAGGKLNGTTLNGKTLVQSDGILKRDSFDAKGNYLRAEADSSTGADDGLASTHGMSGGPVWLDTQIPSEYAPNTTIDLGDNVIGNMSFASLIENPNHVLGSSDCGKKSSYSASFKAEEYGAGFTPIRYDHYSDFTDFHTAKGKQAYIKESFINERDAAHDAEKARIATVNEGIKEQKKEAKDNDPDYDKNDYKSEKFDAAATDQQLRADIEDRVNTPDKLAERFPEYQLVADIRDPGVDPKEGTSETFNGGGFQETLIANSHRSTTSDLQAGRDTVDFERLKHGVRVEIGANAEGDSVLNISKTYDKADDKADGSGQGFARDVYTDAEVVKGTYASDTFVLNDFRDFEAIDGRDSSKGNDFDTLNIGPNVGPVTWEFSRNPDGTRSESGTVTYGDRTVPFENIENVQTRPGDTVNIDGVQVSGPGMTPAAVPVPVTAPSSIPAPSEGEILSGPDHAWVRPGHLSDLPNADGSVPGVNWPNAGLARPTTPLNIMTGAMRGLFTPEPAGMSIEALSRELAETARDVKALDIEQHGAAYTSPEGWRQAHPETHARWDALASGAQDGSLSDMRVEVNLTDAQELPFPPHDRMTALLDGVDRATAAQAEITGQTPRALSGPLSDFARDHPVPGSEAALVARGDEGAMAREAEQVAEKSAQQAAYQETSPDRMMSQTTQDIDRAAEMYGADDAYGYG